MSSSSGRLGDLYQELILDHSRQRHGYGRLSDAAAESHQLNPSCGDEIMLQLHFDGTSGRVTALGWEGHGCAISTASASVLSTLVEGLTVAEITDRIRAFREMMHSKGAVEPDEEVLGDAVALQGVSRYVARIKCAMLAWVACEDALRRVTTTGA